MSRTGLLGLFVFVVAGLSGCASPAKIIQKDPNSVTVAIPDNTDNWPFYYKSEARKAAESELQETDLITTMNRVKVGETMTNMQDTTKRDIGLGDNKPKIGEVTTSRNTTSVSDSYEYHLVFQKRNTSLVPDSLRRVQQPAPTPNGPPIVTAGGMPSPLPMPTPNPANPAGASMPPNPAAIPADITMPALNTPPTPATSLPSMTLPSPGQGR